MFGAELFELCSVSQFPQTALDSGRPAEPVVATAFDVSQELVWTGSEGGWLTSFHVPSMERHSSVHAHESRVLGLKSLPDIGMLSTSEKHVKLHSAGGFLHWSCSDDVPDLTCAETDYTGQQIILGRACNKLSCIDLLRGKITGDMETSTGTTALCRNGMQIVCGGADGTIVLRDFRNGLRAEHTLPAHMSAVVAVDTHRDLLVSCGFTQRHGQLAYDSVVRVYDIRVAARALTHVPFRDGCAALRFHPKFSGQVHLVAASGLLQVADVNSGGASARNYRVDCEGDALLSFDVSSAGDSLAFGDGGGYVHLWANQEDAPVNEFSSNVELPAEPTMLGMIDCNVPLAAIPVFFGDDMPLSTLPPNQSMLVGLAPHKLDATLLKSMKEVDFVGYIANPEFKRGAPPGQSAAKVAALRNARVKGRRTAEEELQKARLRTESLLPKGYHRVLIQKPSNKKVFEEFDFHQYNATNFAGLENGMRNCYVNSLLQVLYFNPWLRSAVLRHICENEFCLACELSFLFHMLRIGAKATVCQASNLLRSLKQIRGAAALGLLEDPAMDAIKGAGQAKPGAILGRRMQSFSRFVLEQTIKEMAATTGCKPDDTAPATLFGTTVRTTTKCLNNKASHAETVRESRSLHFDLHYPSKADAAAPRQPFSALLQQSMSQGAEQRAWCEQCRAYLPLRQSKTLCSCSDILLINANLTQPTDLYWWGVSPEALGMETNAARGAAGKAGAAPAGGAGAGVATEEPWLPPVVGVEVDGTTGRTYVLEGADVAAVRAQMRNDGSAPSAVYELVSLISHIKEGQLAEEEEAGMNPTELRKKRKERDEGHLVAHVRPHMVYYDQQNIVTPPKGTPGLSPLVMGPRRGSMHTKREAPPTPPSMGPSDIATPPSLTSTPIATAGSASPPKGEDWLLFNDFCVTPTTAAEARTLYGQHKTPCLLFFQRVDLPFPPPLPASQITEHMFRRLTPEPFSLKLPQPHTFRPLDLRHEAPYPGMLLAIDCEFVSYAPAEKEVHEDGTELELRAAALGLARVSVVRGDEGQREGMCLIDDYVRTVEPVYDYLTRFSGLVHGDLDPSSSKHHITTLKHAYLKLRYLADMGCKFVGHGLNKDFRMANIVIPADNIIDTLEIFHFKRQRKLSLRFLASFLLGIKIQSQTHNSIEDALVALRLYKKYLELEKAGVFQEKLLEIYRHGKLHGWEVA